MGKHTLCIVGSEVRGGAQRLEVTATSLSHLIDTLQQEVEFTTAGSPPAIDALSLFDGDFSEYLLVKSLKELPAKAKVKITLKAHGAGSGRPSGSSTASGGDAHATGVDAIVSALKMEQVADSDLEGRLKRLSLEDRKWETDLVGHRLWNREVSRAALLKHFRKLSNAVISSDNKQDCPIACTVAGSGGGKTKLLRAVMWQWQDDVRKAIFGSGTERPDVVFLFATFNQSVGYSDEEGPISRSLGVRLVCDFYRAEIREMRRYLRQASDKTSVALDDVFAHVRAACGPNTAIIVLVDEVQSMILSSRAPSASAPSQTSEPRSKRS